MWAIARYDLGLSEAEFWQLTPRLFEELSDRWKAAQARADRRAGEVVAMLYNINRDRKADPRGKAWDDWFPQEDRSEPQTDDQMFAAMKMLALMQRARLARQRD